MLMLMLMLIPDRGVLNAKRESTASPPPVWSCPLCWWWHTKPKVRVVGLNHTHILNCTIVDWRDRRSLYFFTNAVLNTYFWLRLICDALPLGKLQVWNCRWISGDRLLTQKAPQPVAALVSLGPPPVPWRPRSKLAAGRCCFCCLFFWRTRQNKDAEQGLEKHVAPAARHLNPPSTHLSTSPWVEPINSLAPTHRTITLSAQRPLLLKPDTPFCLRWCGQAAEWEARSRRLYTGDFLTYPAEESTGLNSGNQERLHESRRDWECFCLSWTSCSSRHKQTEQRRRAREREERRHARR